MTLARAIEDSSTGSGPLPRGVSRLSQAGAGTPRMDVGFGLIAVLIHDSPMAVVVVDSSLRLIFANPSAQEILEADDGIRTVNGILHEAEAQALEPRLQRTLRGEPDPDGDLCAPFFLPRPSGRRPYEVTLRPVSSAQGNASASPRLVAVYLRDPDRGVAIDERALRERFHLTPAEARTAVALTLGGALPRNSELLKLKPMTIRGYIKQIFAKTDTHSQLDVLRLVRTGVKSLVVDRGPAGLPRE
jgi:DNA-binding CsgD family transcriptional regulator